MFNIPFHQMSPVCMSQCHIHSFFSFALSQISSNIFIESFKTYLISTPDTFWCCYIVSFNILYLYLIPFHFLFPAPFVTGKYCGLLFPYHPLTSVIHLLHIFTASKLLCKFYLLTAVPTFWPWSHYPLRIISRSPILFWMLGSLGF